MDNDRGQDAKSESSGAGTEKKAKPDLRHFQRRNLRFLDKHDLYYYKGGNAAAANIGAEQFVKGRDALAGSDGEEEPPGIDDKAVCDAAKDLFKATLRFPADPKLKGRKLAEDIAFMCTAYPSGSLVNDISEHLWAWVFECSRFCPPHHPWQDALLECLSLYDKWAQERDDHETLRSTFYYSVFYRDFMPGYSCESNMWRNQRSLSVRLSAKDDDHQLYALWEIREILEEYGGRGYQRPQTETPPEFEISWTCYHVQNSIYDATEWLIHSAPGMYKLMLWGEEDDSGEKPTYYGLGSLLNRDPPPRDLCTQRWDFWKRRLRELIVSEAGFVSDETIRRMEAALVAMDRAEAAVAEAKKSGGGAEAKKEGDEAETSGDGAEAKKEGDAAAKAEEGKETSLDDLISHFGRGVGLDTKE